jgi:uncharacterized protein YjiS (DUF1127 family)
MHVTRVTMPAAVSVMSAGTRSPAQPDAAGSFWPAWLNKVLARRAERRQLLALDERDLRDVGLTRTEAWALAQQPLWR